MTDAIYRKFARVLLEVAVNLQGDDILIVRASPQDYLLVREVTTAAYRMGAKYVHIEYEDPATQALRCLHAGAAHLSFYPDWLLRCRAEAMSDRVAVLVLASPDPVIHAGLDEARLAALSAAARQVRTAERNARADGHVSMVTTVVPSAPWARLVYPDLDDEEALTALWADLVRVIYLDAPDPVEAWRAHREDIKRRRDRLDALDIRALAFTGPGTDLTVELAPNIGWTGGCDTNPFAHTEYIPNVPTEEVFCVPHRERVNGRVTATLPLSYNGTLIRDFAFAVRDGLVTEFHAAEGESALGALLRTDEGARRFGEVALVPVSSPIYQTGRIFYNTILDENAVCHIALGNAPFSPAGGPPPTDAERAARGLNTSAVHVDFMVGSERLDVTATTASGARVALMRGGQWTEELL